MSVIAHHLTTVIAQLPIAVVLLSRTGLYLGKAGRMAPMVGLAHPILDKREASRWWFRDKGGSLLPPSQWPSARALRGERDYEGMTGAFVDGETRAIKTISVPTFDPDSDVAAVAFMQVFDTPSRSIDGSVHDLQQKLVDDLANAVAHNWPSVGSAFDRMPAV